MKKISLLLFAFTFLYLSASSYAQMELKPAIGLNFTSFSEDPSSGTTSAQAGYQLGGTVSFGEELYGEGGLFWVYKSNQFTENTTDTEFKTNFGGLRIPVMIGYHLAGKEGGLVGLRVFGGGSVFILTNVKNPFDIPKDDFNTASYGAFLGAGIDLSLFFLDLSYEWSLSDVSSVTSFNLGKARSLFINGGVRISL